MTTYDDDIRSALRVEFDSRHLIEAGKANEVFCLLAGIYPASGSKIDWKRVPGAIEDFERDPSRHCARFIEFFDEMRANSCLEGQVLYVGDSATDFVLAGSIETMRRVLPVLLEVPQHHYFVGPNGSWCMCLTMEGDMSFGRVTTRPLH